MDEKKMIFILAGILIFGFFSLFIIIVPWMNWARSPDWEAMVIDNLLMGLVGAAIIYGIYIGSKTM
jgi:TRAP-type C4-dicarboxylate transport system permease small subunit